MFVKSCRLTNPTADLHCSAKFFTYVVIAFDSFTSLGFLLYYHRHSLVIMRTNVSQKLAELKITRSHHSWLINKSTLRTRLCFQASTHAGFCLTIHCYIPIYSLLRLLLYQQRNRHLFCPSCYPPVSLATISSAMVSLSHNLHSSTQSLVFLEYLLCCSNVEILRVITRTQANVN